jgi:hypothetical protein
LASEGRDSLRSSSFSPRRGSFPIRRLHQRRGALFLITLLSKVVMLGSGTKGRSPSGVFFSANKAISTSSFTPAPFRRRPMWRVGVSLRRFESFPLRSYIPDPKHTTSRGPTEPGGCVYTEEDVRGCRPVRYHCAKGWASSKVSVSQRLAAGFGYKHNAEPGARGLL